jgi:hypothetical protein
MSFCNNCKKTLKLSLLCGGCKAVSYCDKQCQTINWSVHKQYCKSQNLPKIYITMKGTVTCDDQHLKEFCETMIKDCLTGVNSVYIKHSISLTDNHITVIKINNQDTDEAGVESDILRIPCDQYKKYILETFGTNNGIQKSAIWSKKSTSLTNLTNALNINDLNYNDYLYFISYNKDSPFLSIFIPKSIIM